MLQKAVQNRQVGSQAFHRWNGCPVCAVPSSAGGPRRRDRRSMAVTPKMWVPKLVYLSDTVTPRWNQMWNQLNDMMRMNEVCGDICSPRWAAAILPMTNIHWSTAAIKLIIWYSLPVSMRSKPVFDMPHLHLQNMQSFMLNKNPWRCAA